MSKVICDVCGTAYPETATQCPICGCAKPENARTVSADMSAESDTVNSYTYVKGGRFSKANVRKRNKAAAAQRQAQQDLDVQEPEQGNTNRGLIVAIILLSLAIVAVIAYIFVNFLGFGGGKPTDPATTTTADTAEVQHTTTEDTAAIGIVCTDLTLSEDSIEFDEVGEVRLINAVATPANTTDPFVYVSSDPSVATVSDEGRVTAVGPGEAVITVSCGLAEVDCTVVCNIETEPTTEPTTEPDTTATYNMHIDGKNVANRKYKNEVTLAPGKSFQLTIVDADTEQAVSVDWVCADPDVCTVEGSTVTGVAKGNTKIKVTIGDTTYECVVHVTA